jgi:hypothetical protein
MILKRCKLVEAEEPEENGIMKTIPGLGFGSSKELGEGSRPGRST